jgi:hypothetical protein
MKRDKRANNSLPNTAVNQRTDNTMANEKKQRTNNNLPNTAVNQRRTDNTMTK